ncbi:Fmp16p NDAI_0A03670 [Naumovozyma dairenensis CBS 421]|uniref:Uncharacterized protein n=1 Tax=Naumovozyma dairenensis (strain ATCC 10597 / BCRC 20456 / CBS 421 / NBRC 0211 / NRRL Y-12639) TaxID=1071378 RepID=G0W3Y6_NAUDC|nr:hypothetical protein NDAI_0A03670 [Naumovozyma dairenensis CBS 421]CCD22524.1 hypothetical protein NDAI_0A03670 [Naumovozyma dairenensis CBS 421]
MLPQLFKTSGKTLLLKNGILSCTSAAKVTKSHMYYTTKVKPVGESGHVKPNQDELETKEQNVFDTNKKKLERMEHDKTYTEFKQDDCDVLRKKGDDARIEQNRPDDGNY